MGSEFADIFIRLLDACWLFGEIDLEAAESLAGFFSLGKSFPANMNTLHDLISGVSEAVESGGAEGDRAVLLTSWCSCGSSVSTMASICWLSMSGKMAMQ